MTSETLQQVPDKRRFITFISFFVSDLFTAELAITLKKAKNKPASKLTTTVNSITNTGALTRKLAPALVKPKPDSDSDLPADPEFNPGTLWCPQEDYMIWGQVGGPSLH